MIIYLIAYDFSKIITYHANVVRHDENYLGMIIGRNGITPTDLRERNVFGHTERKSHEDKV